MAHELIKSEIIDWWVAERLRVQRECEEARKGIFGRVDQAYDQLSSYDLVLPKSEAYSAIKRRVDADLTTLSKRLSRSIEQAVASSVRLTEGDSAALTDHAGFVLAGAAAVGSVGLAAAAASLATTTATFLVVIPVTTVSWPIFAVAGTGALALAYVSPTAASWTIEKLRNQYLNSVKRQVESALFGTPDAGGETGICGSYLAQLDRLRDSRFETIGTES